MSRSAQLSILLSGLVLLPNRPSPNPTHLNASINNILMLMLLPIITIITTGIVIVTVATQLPILQRYCLSIVIQPKCHPQVLLVEEVNLRVRSHLTRSRLPNDRGVMALVLPQENRVPSPNVHDHQWDTVVAGNLPRGPRLTVRRGRLLARVQQMVRPI